MADILLIRHGQASFGAADYDRLSAVGEEQSRVLGQWFKRTRQTPDIVAVGPRRRHAHTADLCIEASGATAPKIAVAGLDEFDHEEVLLRHRPDLASADALMAELARSDDPQSAFQRVFSAAVARWTSGQFDGEYARSWTRFRNDVLAGVQELAAHEARTIWAFTSGGTIAVIANALVGAPVEQALALAWPLVNTSITRIAVDAKRRNLVGYNAWPHLEYAGEPRLVTHR
jgi:broad specificity phosphatase PhoE